MKNVGIHRISVLGRRGIVACMLAGMAATCGEARDMNRAPDEYVRVPEKGVHEVGMRAITLVSSMAVAPNGRLWAVWYCGPTPAEDQNNYVVLATSEDDGATWRELWVADPDGWGPRRPFDSEVWTAPDGSLQWTWTERVGGEILSDTLWMLTIPDANTVPSVPPVPRVVAKGVMMCKPTFLKDGTWLLPVSRWQQERSSGFYASTDGGKTFFFRGGATMPAKDRLFDEHMVVERKDGSLWCLSRCKSGLREATSRDGGRTWSPLEYGKIKHTSSRLFLRKLASGNILLIKHGPVEQDVGRKLLTAYISKDDGKTWEGGLLIDERSGISYPSGEQAANGTIYITYDFNRTNAREILFCTFTEADVLAGKDVSGKVRMRQLISKGSGRGVVPGCVFKPDAEHAAERQKFRTPESPVLAAPGGRLWKTWAAGPKDDNSVYGVLATSGDGGKKWKNVLISDPDGWWTRRVENPRLAIENGRLVWSWTDRVGRNKDNAQTWYVELDPDAPPKGPFVQQLKQ